MTGRSSGASWDDFFFDCRLITRLWKRPLKRVLSGSWEPFVLSRRAPDPASGLKRMGLYLHVPFCRDLCPFCPYNRREYDEGLYGLFEQGVHDEIRLAERSLNGSRPEVTSLYIGGGTPTVDPAGLVRMVRHLAEAFGPAKEVCVELHPSAMDDACLAALKDAGVTMLSVGVESLQDRLLGLIGRSHDAAAAQRAVARAAAAGFDSVNADLMFALPTQTPEELDSDIRRLLAMGVDQLSTYPMFGFPYTDLGRSLSLDAIRRPNGRLIREMLSIIARRAGEAGLKRCAVWSFLKPSAKKFSSITRHHYLGFGPSAASMTGRQFRVNTFDVQEYSRAAREGRPSALAMTLDERLEMVYWLYWRVYEMKLPLAGFSELFGEDLDSRFGGLLRALCAAGMLTREDGGYRVPESAAYWVHRVQNEYSLNYIDRLWGTCRQEAWPEKVRL
ncbi:MAG: radical SAM protein [Elusimicrobia bacterium]|nr:radical SAM protein [Elusimicrobiota bacterium]